MDCSPAVSSVHRNFPGRTLGWVALPSSRGSFQPRDQTCTSCTAGRFLTNEPPGKCQLRFKRKHLFTRFLITKTYWINFSCWIMENDSINKHLFMRYTIKGALNLLIQGENKNQTLQLNVQVFFFYKVYPHNWIQYKNRLNRVLYICCITQNPIQHLTYHRCLVNTEWIKE